MRSQKRSIISRLVGIPSFLHFSGADKAQVFRPPFSTVLEDVALSMNWL